MNYNGTSPETEKIVMVPILKKTLYYYRYRFRSKRSRDSSSSSPIQPPPSFQSFCSRVSRRRSARLLSHPSPLAPSPITNSSSMEQVDLATTLGANSTSITCVKDLLPFLLRVPVTYVYAAKHVSPSTWPPGHPISPPRSLTARFLAQASLEGFITDGGYACACPASAGCGYHGKVSELDRSHAHLLRNSTSRRFCGVARKFWGFFFFSAPRNAHAGAVGAAIREARGVRVE
jgi:hypothetical protein